MKTRPTEQVNSHTNAQPQHSNELIFCSQTKDIWMSLIFPMLEVPCEVRADSRLRNIWRIAGTCKRARNIALQYIRQGNFYNEDSLSYWEKSNHRSFIDASKHGMRCNQLLFDCNKHANGLQFSIHVARFALAVFTILGLLNIEFSARSLAEGPMTLNMMNTYNNSKYFTTIFGMMTCIFSILIVGLNHPSWTKNREEDKQILEYSRKHRDRLMTKRLALFNEKKPESLIQRFQNSCNIL